MTQRKCLYGGLTLDVDRHYIGSVTATTRQEKGIIILESHPSRGTVLPAPHGKGNKCDKNVNYKRTVTCYLSSSCLVAHRASTERLHSILSAAATLVSFHDRQPASALSFSTVRRQVVFGRPRFLRPSGADVNHWLDLVSVYGQ